MLNYLKKFALDILPSVAATIIGAYIVNHYVSNKPEAPPAATASAEKTQPKKNTPKIASEPKVDTKIGVKAAEPPPETAAIPEPGVKAKGISERALIETRAAERPAEVKPAESAPDPKTVEGKPVEAKPAETASAVVEPRRHPATPARDATELARAAIERLRGGAEAARAPAPEVPRSQEVSRTAVTAPSATVGPSAQTVRPLPPPITVSTPSIDSAARGGMTVNPPYTGAIDPNRPTPPAEIPPPPPRPPFDLRAETANVASHTKNVAEDMLTAAKSMFQAVLPGGGQQNSSQPQQFTD
jgi:hypothetical protein